MDHISGVNMNKRPLRPCKKVGCHNLTRERYCETHSNIEIENKAISNKYYDKYKRNKKHDSFYKSKDWLSVREYILVSYNGIDIYEYYTTGIIRPARVVHHIIEIEEDWGRRLDLYNLFPTTTDNHNKIDRLYRQDKKMYQEQLFDMLKRYRYEMGIRL